MSKYFLIVWLCLGLANGARAEVVAVNGGEGYGFLFHYGQECLMILPSHVHDRRATIRFEGASAAVAGRAMVAYQNIDELDLTLASVGVSQTMPCGPEWFDLTAVRGHEPAAEVTLARLQSQGYRTLTPMVTTEVGMTRFTGQLLPGFEAEGVYQGTSGATAFDGTVPVGMAIQAPDDTHAIFLRYPRIIEAIARVRALPLQKPFSRKAGPDIPPAAAPVLVEDTTLSDGVYTSDPGTIAPVQLLEIQTE